LLTPSQADTSHAAVDSQPQPEVRAEIADSRCTTASAIVGSIVFLTFLLVINHRLFSVPIHEYMDFAANALQIEKAKHFHELLGNYSRWGFHHPGPAFFYIFAFGESVFFDAWHLVPAEMNSQILTIVLVNIAFLFGTIAILAKYCRSRLFVPAALSLSLFFIYILNRTIPGSAILSIWMPYVLLFPFLFFVTVCAAVAIGEVSKLPLLTFAGWLLIHGHTAQPLFVGTLSALSIAVLWLRKGRARGWKQFIGDNRRPVIISLVLCVGFATPIVLEAFVDAPNNFHAILVYSSGHKGLQQRPGMALKYEASFLAFVPDTEIVLQAKSAHLISLGGSKTYVALYWCLGWLLMGLLVGIYARKWNAIPLFWKYIAGEILLVFLLFYIWTLKIGGPLYNFNGFFFFGMQLLALMAMAALVLDGLNISAPRMVAIVLCALIPTSMFAARSEFKNGWPGEPVTDRLYAAIPPDIGPVHIRFIWDDWLQILGVAYRMEREGRPFCLDNPWIFSFSPNNVCRDMDSLKNLMLTRAPRECTPPCRILLKDPPFELQVEPYPFFKLPFDIKPDNIQSLNINFMTTESGPSWSERTSTVYFRLASDFGDAPKIRVTVRGTATPGRPAQIILNGHTLGTIEAGPSSSDFVVDRSLLRAGEQNALVIQVDNAGPDGPDPRTFGFHWNGLRFTAATP